MLHREHAGRTREIHLTCCTRFCDQVIPLISSDHYGTEQGRGASIAARTQDQPQASRTGSSRPSPAGVASVAGMVPLGRPTSEQDDWEDVCRNGGAYASASGAAMPPPYPEADGTLPHGIKSIHDWGRTVIEFGETVKNRTYLDVATGMDKVAVGHRKWILSQTSLSPLVLDFQKYLRVGGFEEKGSGILIPGTSAQRKFRRNPLPSEPGSKQASA